MQVGHPTQLGMRQASSFRLDVLFQALTALDGTARLGVRTGAIQLLIQVRRVCGVSSNSVVDASQFLYAGPLTSPLHFEHAAAVLLFIQALQVAHLAFATDIGWSWPSLWVSWLHAVSYGVSFDRYVPNLYSWEWSAAVAIASSLVLLALVLCGFKLRDQHRKGEFVQQQDWIANNSTFAFLATAAPLVRRANRSTTTL